MIFRILLFCLFIFPSCTALDTLGNNFEYTLEKDKDSIILEYDPNHGGDVKALMRAKKHCKTYQKRARFKEIVNQDPQHEFNTVVKYECYR